MSGILCSFLIIPVAAMGKEITGTRISRQSGKRTLNRIAFFSHSPPTSRIIPLNRGTYSGPCPIGTGGAPQLRRTGLSSGAECRGACGMDCPESRCTIPDDVKIEVKDGTCTYKNLRLCPTHRGCIDHDACYDYCTEKAGDNSVVFGHCHGLCNGRCYYEYGIVQCSKWAALPGLSSMLDFVTDPPPMPVSLVFSDEPVFTPDSATCDYSNPKNVICY